MPHDGRPVADMEGLEQSLVELVGMGHPRVLALVFDPALDDEALDDPPGLRDIFPDGYVSTGSAEIAICSPAWRLLDQTLRPRRWTSQQS